MSDCKITIKVVKNNYYQKLQLLFTILQHEASSYRDMFGKISERNKPKPVIKKKKKKKSVSSAYLTRKLVEKWEKFSNQNNEIRDLFERVDHAFDMKDSKRLPLATINSAPYPGRCVPDHLDAANVTDVLRWFELRDHYLRQLKELCVIVNDCNDRETPEVTNLILLLCALRKITVRIVSAFENVCLSYNKKNNKMLIDSRTLIQITDYVRTIATSVDWMAAYPKVCESIIQVNPILNPFLSTQRIDGKPATFSSIVDSLPFELTLDGNELDQC